jgi:hypothetical protein
MATIDRTVATLRIAGDTLDPADVTRALGCDPTSAQVKGQELVGAKTGRVRIARIGMWRLEARDQQPGNLNAQIQEILGRLTHDLSVWRDIASRHSIDLFCGLFMLNGNEGLSISPDSMSALGSRGIELGLDIYGELKEAYPEHVSRTPGGQR